MIDQSFVDGSLVLELHEEPDAMRLVWRGLSQHREPAAFVSPLLAMAIDLAGQRKLPLVIDFRQLEFINSASVLPVARALEQARRAGQQVRVVYSKNVPWQELGFTALSVFRTEDHRIDVTGQ